MRKNVAAVDVLCGRFGAKEKRRPPLHTVAAATGVVERLLEPVPLVTFLRLAFQTNFTRWTAGGGVKELRDGRAHEGLLTLAGLRKVLHQSVALGKQGRGYGRLLQLGEDIELWDEGHLAGGEAGELAAAERRAGGGGVTGEEAVRRFAGGVTVVLNQLQYRVGPIAQLAEALEVPALLANRPLPLPAVPHCAMLSPQPSLPATAHLAPIRAVFVTDYPLPPSSRAVVQPPRVRAAAGGLRLLRCGRGPRHPCQPPGSRTLHLSRAFVPLPVLLNQSTPCGCARKK